MHLLKCLSLALGLSLVLGNSPLAAQPAEIWEHLDDLPQRRGLNAEVRIKPNKFRAVRINGAPMRQLLGQAPKETVPGRIDKAETISLPMPDGSTARFRFAETQVMEPELAAKFPEIKTYVGQGIDDPAATIRFDINPSGFHAQILSPSGAVYIDPYFKDDAETHVAYYKRDYPRDVQAVRCLQGDVAEDVALREESTSTGTRDLNRSGTILRTYRLACAATGEYTAFHGGTVSGGQAAIVTAINRVNQVYENEISVRLVLVANNNVLVFTNAGTDPYSNDDGIAMLAENQTKITTAIGAANYDIGHVFSTGGGGVATLGCVCNNSLKARGVTGSSAPINDPFYIDYVAHEMGHQFGAEHTFNAVTGSCNGNRSSSVAYEPGSGSTIMAYAGICPPNDLQGNSDPYFHSASFDNIVTFLAGTGGGCAANSATGNTVPTVDAGVNYTIPKGTPFTLTATGSDANGDTLTYCWEQRDLGAAQALSDPDNGTSPIFRSFNPTTSPSRTFPRLSNLLAGTASVGEKLPTVARTMDFRVTVRDNRAGGGGVNTDDMVVNVDGASGPFVITSPNTSVTWSNVQTVTWNVAGTTFSPVNCSQVNILLSTNGGLDFPIILAQNTPNDGTQAVSLPSVNTSAARIKVQGAGNIFFDISDVNFSLVRYAGAEITSVSLLSEGCAPTNNAVDPSETVSVRVAVRNSGIQALTNVSVTLVADVSINSPSAPQDYGTLATNAAAITRDFSFTANALCGSTITANFEIRTNGVLQETFSKQFPIGSSTVVVQSRTNSTSFNIPGTGTAAGNAGVYPSTITVSGVTNPISKVTVTLVGLSHTWPADLQVLLVSPGGQKVVLMANAGADDNITSANITFDDSAAPIAFDPPSTTPAGNYTNGPSVYTTASFTAPAPAGPYATTLSTFTNSAANGTWSLYMRDSADVDTGSMQGWRLNINSTIIACCAGNAFPVVSAITDRSINEDTETPTINFTVSDAETAAGSLVVTASSSNTNLVPNANLTLGGSGSNRTLVAVPAANQFGSTVITVSVFDGINTTTRTFTLTVNPTNDPPVMVSISNMSIHQGTTLVLTNKANDVDTPSSNFTFALVSAPVGATLNTNTGVLTWTPATNQITTHSFSVRVFDNGSPNLNDIEFFDVTVIARPLQIVTRNGNQFNVAWTAIAGKSYQILMKTNLNDVIWQPVTTVTPANSSGTFSDTIGNGSKFYKIQLQ